MRADLVGLYSGASQSIDVVADRVVSSRASAAICIGSCCSETDSACMWASEGFDAVGKEQRGRIGHDETRM